MSRAAIALAASLLGATLAGAQEPAPDQSLDRMKAVLGRKPLNLSTSEPEPTFKIEIHAIHPLHEIFEKPPWQLPPIIWHVPAMGPSTAFGSIPMMSVDLLALGRSMARARDQRAARAEVQREIAAYCAAQPNALQIQICSPSRAVR